MRKSSASNLLMREVTEDVEFAGVLLPAGTMVKPTLGLSGPTRLLMRFDP